MSFVSSAPATGRSVHLLQQALALLGRCVHHQLYHLLLAIADPLPARCRDEPLLGMGLLHTCSTEDMRAQRGYTGLCDRLRLGFESWQGRASWWNHLKLVDNFDRLAHVEGQGTERRLNVYL